MHEYSGRGSTLCKERYRLFEQILDNLATMPISSTEVPVSLEGHLPEGVILRSLTTYPDHRGALTEIFRKNWETGIEPVQWNVAMSAPGTLRGVHVHRIHVDYLVLLSGLASIGLRDLRSDSPTAGVSALVELSDKSLRTLTIPPGVAHGFYFHEASILVYGVSHYWDVDDEFCCRWDDSELDIPWPARSVTLSERDAAAPPLSALLIELEPWQPLGARPSGGTASRQVGGVEAST
jgi:dTDP-4-dehydrorhamnose 3,5-epimerase